ncbi:MAG: CsgG/HfaB family protein [Pseudomonadota bacterium]
MGGTTLGLALLAVGLVLGGCTSARMAQVNARLGLAPAAAPALAPELAVRLDTLFREGAEALARDDLDGAMASWRQYAAQAPAELPRARDVRGYLTLLEREAAKRFARQAVAQEQAAGLLKTDRLHVALLPFRSKDATGGNASRPFNRAIQAMVATDLAQVPSLTILERSRMDFLLREMKLAESGLVDPASAARAGRMLGAGSLVAGLVFNEDTRYDPYQSNYYTGRYTISTAVSDVDRGTVVGTQEASGYQYNYFELQKKIVRGILDSLGVKDIPPAVDKIHTKNWDAYARFTEGLRLLEEENFPAARQAFLAALNFDPDFALAEAAYLDTPEKQRNLAEVKAAVAAP